MKLLREHKIILFSASLWVVHLIAILAGAHFLVSYMKVENRRLEQEAVHDRVFLKVNAQIVAYQRAAEVLSWNWVVRRELTSENGMRDRLAGPVCDTVRSLTGASIVYLMDAQGTVIESTVYDGTKSLFGKNYAFRPYFQEAIQGRPKIYPAVGVTTYERGIYFSHPVFSMDGKKPVGVVVIKAPVDAIERELSLDKETRTLLITAEDVVFASSHKDWLFHIVKAPSPARKKALIESRQFADLPLPLLEGPATGGEQWIEGIRHTVSVHRMPILNWRIAMYFPADQMSSLRPVQKTSVTIALIAAIVVNTLFIALLAFVRLRAEVQSDLYRSTLKFEAVFNKSFQLMGMLDTRGTLLEANDAAMQLLSARNEPAIGKPFWETAWWSHDPKLQQRLREAVTRAAAGEFVRFEASHVADNGEVMEIDFSLKPVRDKNGVVTMLIPEGRDITYRKKIEKELSELRIYLENIIDSIPSMLVTLDREGCITGGNRAAEFALGVLMTEARGRHLEDFLPAWTNWKRLADEGDERASVRVERKQGAHIGGVDRIVDVWVFPLQGSGTSGVVVKIDDVTEQVRLETIVIQSEKMMSVGGLAAGLAHEINNPLAGMLQGAQVLENRLLRPGVRDVAAAAAAGIDVEAMKAWFVDRKVDVLLDAIIGAGIRSAALVKQILGFARHGGESFEEVRLSDILDDTVGLLSADFSPENNYDFKKFEIVREFDDSVPKVKCCSADIQMVFLNLLKNGAQAMATSGREGRFILRIKADKGFVRAEIEDTGPGISEELQRRIFEPFFTTKPVGQGTGLGLSISYFIVADKHGGHLLVDSAAGRGTRFIVELPIAAKVET